MNDKERLKAWMAANGYTNGTLAAKMGEIRHTIYYMTRGKRPVGDAFKHRFYATFGHEVFEQVFPTEKAEVA